MIQTTDNYFQLLKGINENTFIWINKIKMKDYGNLMIMKHSS